MQKAMYLPAALRGYEDGSSPGRQELRQKAQGVVQESRIGICDVPGHELEEA